MYKAWDTTLITMTATGSNLDYGSGTAFSQCCTSGNPFISDAEQPALESEILTSSLVYRYNRSHQYY